MPKKVERLKSAATRYKGKVYVGKNHILIFDEIEKRHPEVLWEDCLHGFLTTTGRLLDRDEALTLAIQQRVVHPLRPGEVEIGLSTENLTEEALQGA